MTIERFDKKPPAVAAGTTRLLAPDLARGFTLLGIAIANAATAWLPAPLGSPGALSGGIVDDSVWDKIAIVFGAMFVHVRGVSMFAVMLGYGIGMITLSLARRGYPFLAARKVLVRRYGFLALFGLVHMTVLFYGDIMFFYGMAAMLLAYLIRFRTKSLLVIAGVVAAMYIMLMTLSGISIMIMGYGLSELPATGAQLGSVGVPQTWEEYFAQPVTDIYVGFGALFFSFPMLMPMIILGFVAARYRILDHPEQHKKMLTIAALVTAAVPLLVGLPWGLSQIGVLPRSLEFGLSLVNNGLGVLTGPGIIAIIALASIPLQRKYGGDGVGRGGVGARERRLPVFVQMILALGKRSMTGYVLQSVILLPLCAPFLLGLLRPQGAAYATIVGFGVWVATLLIAFVLEKLGRRGPFEAAHRRLSYGKNGLYQQYPVAELGVGGDAGGAGGVGGVGGVGEVRGEIRRAEILEASPEGGLAGPVPSPINEDQSLPQRPES